MSAPLQADAARAVASGIASTDDDALYRRIGARIVPFLFPCYIVSILDRSNIGFAQLQMRQDLGLTDAMYSLGAVLFFVGYVLFEVPSNALLRRFGARRTFARIMFLWGAVSVAAMLIFAAHPVFWAVPSVYFSGAGAAGGIALISSIGVSSGMITPWLVGLIRTRTGSMDLAMLMIAALLAPCAVAMLPGVRAAPRAESA
ncbi:MFS transporter [Burkholderia sp. AU38729]|uniref:MFS transporter n=1 Tax=Burkholderia sp. AU38729 TaxID=2879633 RepID=UPI001CF4CA91|nr:MFS transporter [Burkholderia sp. AU38729]MCA8061867.1 MFS transporter [Burkholderia sp. AU38729]